MRPGRRPRPAWVLGLALALAGCGGAARIVRVDGSTGAMPLAAELAAAFHARRPGVAIEMGGGMGSGERIRALASGEIDIALASHGLDAEELAREGLVAHEIARGAVVFAVHAGVPVAGLSEARICDVFAGRVTNWREVGGPDLAIVPLVRPESEVDAEVVLERVGCWEGLRLAGSVRVVPDPSDMARAIASTPGAIGMTSMPLVERSGGAVRPLALDGRSPDPESVARGAYDLTRRFFLVTRASPPEAVGRFLEFVRSEAGREVIRASGAVPTP